MLPKDMSFLVQITLFNSRQLVISSSSSKENFATSIPKKHWVVSPSLALNRCTETNTGNKKIHKQLFYSSKCYVTLYLEKIESFSTKVLLCFQFAIKIINTLLWKLAGVETQNKHNRALTTRNSVPNMLDKYPVLIRMHWQKPMQ